MGFPLIRILSRTATMCGDVYSPTFAFGAIVVSKDEQNAEVEPFKGRLKVHLMYSSKCLTLPFVPVICRTFSLFSSSG